jgi:hypothetical protein
MADRFDQHRQLFATDERVDAGSRTAMLLARCDASGVAVPTKEN